ncbi:hypothetical protein [Kitasatospora sp. NPDC057223]|uniref:hypothetical protein n=1 Tax=Kitasatospora sp. NPDC057223 TaxID=3346055 RepID=UPI003642150A
MVEGLADITGTEWAGGLVEDGEDARIVGMIRHLVQERLGREAIRERRDDAPGDRKVFEMGLRFP